MISSIKHRALRRYFETGEARGLPPELLSRLRLQLAAMNAADRVEELGIVPGWRLHRLKGDLKEYWSLSVSGNWRLIFRFANSTAEDVDLIDYH